MFAVFFIQSYQHKREKEFGSTVVGILAIVSALLTSSLIPVDIFLVSSFKSSDGVYHEWASMQNVAAVTDTVRYAYYAFYALTIAFIFVFIPLAYFYYEEKDEEAGTTGTQRLCASMKYTIGLLIVMGVLMCIGAFALGSGGNTCDNRNGTDIADWTKCKAEYAEHALTDNGGNNALSFTIGFLTFVGVTYFIMYTAVGMVTMPIDMIRSRGGSKEDIADAEAQLRLNEEKQDSIRAKYSSGSARDKKKKKMSAKDERTLDRLREEERQISSATKQAKELSTGCLATLGKIFRPFEFLFGIAFMVLGVFLTVSLVMTSSDKLYQITDQKLDWKTGYTHVAPKLINPVDKAMNEFQKAFPVDYVLMTLIIYYFLMATMAGVRQLGVRFCGMKVFNIRRQRTPPQALLFMCTIVMFTMLFINVVLLTLAPQYMTYGNQRYPTIDPYVPAKKGDPATCHHVQAFPPKATALCDSQAPQYMYTWTYNHTTYQLDDASFYNSTFRNGCVPKSVLSVCVTNTTTIDYDLDLGYCDRVTACTSTRVAALLHAFFYNLWFFGAIYYWANWGFIGVFFLSLVYFTCKRRRSLVQSLLNDAKEDTYESDDDMTPFNPSWARK